MNSTVKLNFKVIFLKKKVIRTHQKTLRHATLTYVLSNIHTFTQSISTPTPSEEFNYKEFNINLNHIISTDMIAQNLMPVKWRSFLVLFLLDGWTQWLKEARISQVSKLCYFEFWYFYKRKLIPEAGII